MDWQNLIYALVQVAHNFGAAAVVGGALFSLWPARQPAEIQRRLAWLVLTGWTVQGVSGGIFGAASYLFYGQLPDIHGIAIAALLIKIVCAIAGFLLAAAYLLRAADWDEDERRRAWRATFGLGATALGAAAFLRWFS
ncbi:MAG: hypothetical protein PHX38_05485 [Sulfuricella sp.]|nr:hypothetical protein [Sulfuricella sp.]